MLAIDPGQRKKLYDLIDIQKHIEELTEDGIYFLASNEFL